MAKVTQGFSDNDPTLIAPSPTKEASQRSLSADDLYIRRWVTPWAQPQGVSANAWRDFVKSQPIAMDCKETLQASLIGFDWSITARDSKQRDELRGTIKYYTKLLDKGGEYFGFGYEGLIEWVLSDFLDIPFGSGAEIGRKNDSPNGRVVWIKPLDGATLYPTGNKKIPVIQYYNGYLAKFPEHAIARVFMSPSPNIEREGWGLAPPEKIYFAMEMLSRGDRYYANLLLDAPPAGILDLGDMEKDSALDWVKSFREWYAGSPSSFAIPVLYEHNNDVKFLPFGKVPNDIMYDRITLKYAAIVAASYGMSLSDIGLQTTSSSGETLAGSIRQERRTRRTGIARAKKAIKTFMESFLPYSLQFNIVDPDDEVNVAMGRARLASFTAFRMAKEDGTFSPQELRLQTIRDGLMSQEFPESIPDDVEPKEDEMSEAKERPGLLGNPESAANGGQGEIRMSTVSVYKSRKFDENVLDFITELTEKVSQKFSEIMKTTSEDDLYLVRSAVDTSLFGEEDILELNETIKSVWRGKNWLRVLNEKDFQLELSEIAKANNVDEEQLQKKLSEIVTSGAKEFLGKSAIYLLKEVLLTEDGIDGIVSDNDNNTINIVQNVYKSFLRGFDEYLRTYVSMEVQNLLEKGL